MPDDVQYIKLPDGSYGKFRADAKDEDIQAAISKDFPEAVATSNLPGIPRPIPAALQGPPNLQEQMQSAAQRVQPFGNPSMAIPTMQKGARDISGGNTAAGTHEVLSGAGEFLKPGMALAGPVRLAGGLAGGYLLGKGLRVGGEAAGLNPDQANVAEDIGNIVGGTAGAFSPEMRAGVGRYIHDPETGKLTTGARLGSQTAGLAVGGTIGHATGVPEAGFAGAYGGARLGPYVLDKMFPQPQVATYPGAALPSADEFYANRGKELNAIRKMQPQATAVDDATRSRTDASGAMNPPLRPLVGTPEEWQTYDAQKAILKPEASDAGLFSAARGAVNKKLNYQQRIERKLQ